eukprot:TRINITY_DN2458_c0_g1_i1.p1 TRINITY_DN2458_c0_g1~~TRINITY_DN2458_c0_g1_i1.p1  ORF type:complete len:189 (-),score=33.76 TRINITY_DN2458_c0_g1_i1:941-1507(-)
MEAQGRQAKPPLVNDSSRALLDRDLLIQVPTARVDGADQKSKAFVPIGKESNSQDSKSTDEMKKLFHDMRKYTKRILENPADLRSYYKRAAISIKLGESILAIDDYSKILHLDDRSVYAYFNRGSLYAQVQELELAVSDFTKCIELQPRMLQAYYNRGMALSKLSRSELAIQDYTSVVQIDPRFFHAW